MTENKRFTIRGYNISDHKKKRIYDLSNIDGFISILETLNELNEENAELKNDYKTLQLQYDSLNDYRKELKQENEELKSDLAYKERVIEIYQQKQEENMKNCQGDME